MLEKQSLYILGVVKWMHWMDMDLDFNGWIKKGQLVHYNLLFFLIKKNYLIEPLLSISNNY